MSCNGAIAFHGLLNNSGVELHCLARFYPARLLASDFQVMDLVTGVVEVHYEMAARCNINGGRNKSHAFNGHINGYGVGGSYRSWALLTCGGVKHCQPNDGKERNNDNEPGGPLLLRMLLFNGHA